MQRLRVLICVWASIVGTTFYARGATISLPPSADTSLLQLQPDFNLGAQEDFPAGTLGVRVGTLRTRALLRFDLSGNLPSNAIIRAAFLRLTVTHVPEDGGVNSNFSLHRMLRAWGEGNKKGGSPGGTRATDGEATWNARFFPDVLWGSPGGQPDLDYASQPSASERVLQLGTFEFEISPNRLGELQTWLREPSTNFGWMLLTQSEETGVTARRFAGREYPQTNSRPALVIEYTTARAIAPPWILSISLLNDTPEIKFTAEAGVRYTLEIANDLVGVTWQPLPASAVASTDGELTLTDSSALVTQRIYRIAATE